MAEGQEARTSSPLRAPTNTLLYVTTQYFANGVFYRCEQVLLSLVCIGDKVSPMFQTSHFIYCLSFLRCLAKPSDYSTDKDLAKYTIVEIAQEPPLNFALAGTHG